MPEVSVKKLPNLRSKLNQRLQIYGNPHISGKLGICNLPRLDLEMTLATATESVPGMDLTAMENGQMQLTS
jgi:hypothetical protein